jgi:hypothetical protein
VPLLRPLNSDNPSHLLLEFRLQPNNLDGTKRAAERETVPKGFAADVTE